MRFRDTATFKKPIPTADPDIFVSADFTEEKWQQFRELTKDKENPNLPVVLTLKLFRDFVCDKDGNKFQDMQTEADVKAALDEKALSAFRVQALVADGLADEMGKYKTTKTSV